MMKQNNIKMPFRMLSLVIGLILSVGAFAQIDVKGHVKDAQGEPVIGATVRVVGTQTATITDFDGNFALKANQGADISVTYIGYKPATAKAAPNVVITLEDDATTLNDVVVIGYGAVKKSDLTGSVTALKPDSKNKGLIVNPQDMIAGKVAGVNITSDGGAPGSGATIRIRGGSSLNASNSPLIVIDGIPMDNNGVKGLSNGLSMVNPQDIESFNILKDASATAIYGSRGSNGVIIITTKKGHKNQAPQVAYNGSLTISSKNGNLHLMNGDQYRAWITDNYGADSEAAQALGTANTNWQDEIYRTAVSHDHNISVTGALKNLPYRLSIGYTNQEGIVKKSNFERYTAALNLNPSFFEDHLTLNLNGKGMFAKTDYPAYQAISDAFRFDPTQSPYDKTSADAANYGGYFEWKTVGGVTDVDPTYATTFNTLAPGNPVAMNNLRDQNAISRSFVGSADIDYKVHGFEDLRLHMSLGADISKGVVRTIIDKASPQAFYYGYYGYDELLKRTLSLNTYAQYYKDFNADHHFDIMAGYEWQHFWRSQNYHNWGAYPATHATQAGQWNNLTYGTYKTENYLVSFFGRMNYIFKERYYLTATLRDDGSSRFKDHWSLFPSVALAYKISEEKPLKDINWLSDLKLRLGWGKTGQQEGIGDYNYFAIYNMNTSTRSTYPLLGSGSLYTPQAYDPNLKWETTTTWNIGLDFGILKQRLSGSLDWYYRKTTDLLNSAQAAAGTNFDNRVMTNIGSLRNTGIELALNYKAIQTKDWYWTIDYNLTYNNNKITELTGANTKPIENGNTIHSNTGKYVKAYAVGKPAGSFWVYQQAYDENGKAIEGAVVDRNADGSITDDDRYFYKSSDAPVTMGLSSRLEYKNWDLGMSFRASFGNYVYNDVEASRMNMSQLWAPSKFLEQRPTSMVKLNWQTSEWGQTDYFIHNASFLKCDNITLGYTFNNLFKCASYKGLSGRVYATVSNVFTITNYDGLDPEVFSGVDYELYPRPTSFILGLNLNF